MSVSTTALARPAAVLLAIAAGAAARSFAPGEQAWCSVCEGYVDAPHDCDKAQNANWCDQCEGYFTGVSERTHLHVGGGEVPRPVPAAVPASAPVQPVVAVAENGHVADVVEDAVRGSSSLSAETTAAGPGEASAASSAAAFAARILPPEVRGRPLALASAFAAVLFAAVLLARRRRNPSARTFKFVRGKPVGVELVPGSLVCLPEPSFDGGTAMVHRALWRDGRRWRPAFVKRMVGAGLRQDVRFPALRFESDVLRKLAETGVVPRVLAPAAETTLRDGERWAFYAMSVAPGRPWPERGGLGRDTKPALLALCEALVALHRRGIGHHDLKPQNIFWDSGRKTVTLLDFGSAIDHSGTVSALVNPLGSTYPKTLPWVAPEGDGRHLADLSAASDAWVYGLLFCEALTGGIHDENRTKRRWPERPEDRDWLREALSGTVSPRLADAVVDGLFCVRRDRRMALGAFLRILRGEWEA